MNINPIKTEVTNETTSWTDTAAIDVIIGKIITVTVSILVLPKTGDNKSGCSIGFISKLIGICATRQNITANAYATK